MSCSRFAIYYVPPAGGFAAFGARWLGWDVNAGVPMRQPDIFGIDAVTATPRKYGFHGTLKPPMRLAEGCDLIDLKAAIAAFAKTRGPAICDGLQISRLGQFLALTPQGDPAKPVALARDCVTELDRFRAPAEESELVRRRTAGLTPAQDTNLQRWGYPYVLDEFRFHMTLTGKLAPEALTHWKTVLTNLLPPTPNPFVIDAITLAGERRDGRFELIERFALTG